jgi:hypothetical protein
MSFTPWDFFVLDQITKEQNVDTVARHLADNYSGDVDYDEFCEACRECNIEPSYFDQDDINTIQHKLISL